MRIVKSHYISVIEAYKLKFPPIDDFAQFSQRFTVVDTVSYPGAPAITYRNVYICKVLLHWQQLKCMSVVKSRYNSIIEAYKLESPSIDSLQQFSRRFIVVDTVPYPGTLGIMYRNVYIYKVLLHWQQLKYIRILKSHYNSVIEPYKLESPPINSLPRFSRQFTMVNTIPVHTMVNT